MWIIRFQKLKTSDYNRINRLLKKHGFVPRKFSCIILTKSIIIHILQKKSWRIISKEIGVGYIALYNFFNFLKEKDLIAKIFHKFIDRRICLFIEEKQVITKELLDNNLEIISLTKNRFNNMLMNI